MATHSNILMSMENPMDRGAWQVTVSWGHKESGITEMAQTHALQIEPPPSCWVSFNEQLLVSFVGVSLLSLNENTAKWKLLLSSNNRHMAFKKKKSDHIYQFSITVAQQGPSSFFLLPLFAFPFQNKNWNEQGEKNFKRVGSWVKVVKLIIITKRQRLLRSTRVTFRQDLQQPGLLLLKKFWQLDPAQIILRTKSIKNIIPLREKKKHKDIVKLQQSNQTINRWMGITGCLKHRPQQR